MVLFHYADYTRAITKHGVCRELIFYHRLEYIVSHTRVLPLLISGSFGTLNLINLHNGHNNIQRFVTKQQEGHIEQCLYKNTITVINNGLGSLCTDIHCVSAMLGLMTAQHSLSYVYLVC